MREYEREAKKIQIEGILEQLLPFIKDDDTKILVKNNHFQPEYQSIMRSILNIPLEEEQKDNKRYIKETSLRNYFIS